jgi:hypothetical protein
MKRHLAVAGTALAVTAVMGCTAMATTSPAADRTPGGHTTIRATELRYLDVRTETEFLDLGKPAGEPSPGDAYYFGGTLRYADSRDASSGRLAGRFLSTCMFLVGTQAKCSGSLLLNSGTIQLAGTPDFSSAEPIAAAVVGGTGRYRSASGEVTITATDDQDVSVLVVRIDGATR